MTPPALDSKAALFIDVDGTLLEIAPRPELVRVPPEVPPLLERLSRQRGGALALVSGRRIADLDRLVRPWRGAAAGLHGAERRRPDGRAVEGADSPDELAALADLDRLRPLLREIAAELQGVWLEDKGTNLALHYRAAPEKEDEILDRAGRLMRETGNRLRLIAGKMVVELQTRRYNKGNAIAAFLAEPPFLDRPPVFLGDDTTDEDGFAEVNRRGGFSIRVGPPSVATTAVYALPSVAAALAWLGAVTPAGGTQPATGRSRPRVAGGGQDAK
jgi:trehalose 6-phosphate phosphatase